MVVRAICTALGHSDYLLDHVGLRAPVMAANMTIGMAVWMRYRRHNWGAIAEMGGAMFVPLAILIGPFWAGVLSDDALLGWMHVLMLPAMVIAMRHRRDEYAQDHHHHVGVTPRPSGTTWSVDGTLPESRAAEQPQHGCSGVPGSDLANSRARNI